MGGKSRDFHDHSFIKDKLVKRFSHDNKSTRNLDNFNLQNTLKSSQNFCNFEFSFDDDDQKRISFNSFNSFTKKNNYKTSYTISGDFNKDKFENYRGRKQECTKRIMDNDVQKFYDSRCQP